VYRFHSSPKVAEILGTKKKRNNFTAIQHMRLFIYYTRRTHSTITLEVRNIIIFKIRMKLSDKLSFMKLTVQNTKIMF